MFRGLLEYQHCTIFLLFIPSQNLQDMDERRTVKLGETYRSFAEAERRVIPIVSKCLEGMVSAAKAVDERRVCSKLEDGCTVKKKKKCPEEISSYLIYWRHGERQEGTLMLICEFIFNCLVSPLSLSFCFYHPFIPGCIHRRGVV